MMDSMGDGGSAVTALMILVWLLTVVTAFAAGWLAARRGLPARLVRGHAVPAGELGAGPDVDDAEALLRRRLASGEIDDTEFLQRLSALESGRS
ncbi:SHOCT domain-containing protein [Nocardioides guangzhouensis]|uniref:SHOCT domain-containing protein n=1 Tax=Nocardioides guangzhouensis TaxID=2497878 RepID=A0A4Q4ZL15_9ACTN|nr:SHOCT domain-containing protein [Nocardioides guangzhouensis]RYP88271.1 SHOCT domain-containing protein [Nocardioides guangzhouensis]